VWARDLATDSRILLRKNQTKTSRNEIRKIFSLISISQRIHQPCSIVDIEMFLWNGSQDWAPALMWLDAVTL
jgi:hypothetical protein